MDNTIELQLRTRAHDLATQMLDGPFSWLGGEDDPMYQPLLARLKDAMCTQWCGEVQAACDEAARDAISRTAQDKLDELQQRGAARVAG
jgi:glutamate synthase domain-containing protein 1